MKSEETEDATVTIEEPAQLPPEAIAPARSPLESYPPLLGNEERGRQMAAKRAEEEPAPPPDILTAEQWAEKKGLLPQFRPIAAPFAPAGAPTTMEHNPSFWRFAATRAGSAWPIGKELTEAEFDAAVEQATSQTYR